MRIIKQSVAVGISALLLSGCGWKMVQTPLRIQGQVLESGTINPVEGAYIDISDDKDKLDFAIKTDVVTDKDGMFDTIYKYTYEKWIWLGIPVFWFRNTPELLYVEAFKKGYRRRIVEFAYPPDMIGDTEVPFRIDPIRIQKTTPSKKSSKHTGAEKLF
jgi:hypothetical protein